MIKQIELFKYGIVIDLGEGKLWIRTNYIPLKIDFASNPYRVDVLAKCIYDFLTWRTVGLLWFLLILFFFRF